MNYFFDCPYCSQSFEVDSELAGLNCACTGCGEVFVVPTPPKDEGRSVSNRLDDQDDLRPEVWMPDDGELIRDGTLLPESEGGVGAAQDPLSAQYAGDAVIGDRIVPVNFVPTGMEAISEVYGMIPEPSPDPHASRDDLPAEVSVRRVTPMMIESSASHRADLRTGIIRTRREETVQSWNPTRDSISSGWKYALLGIALGVSIGAGGVGMLKRKRQDTFSEGTAMNGVKGLGVEGQARQAESRPTAETSSVSDKFPDGFLGIKFGSRIDYIADRVTWAKEGENLHKPAMLADEKVQAVLIPDHEGRLTVGAYVRISDAADSESVPFLEWALTVQDAISSKFGRPSSVHVVKNAATELDIIRKIRSGDDFYECIWEDPYAQCVVTLTVSGRSTRLLVFRLEYKSIPLTKRYLDRKMEPKSN